MSFNNIVKGFGVKKPKKNQNQYTIYINFLQKLLKVISSNPNKPKVAYRLLEANQDKLNQEFPPVFRRWLTTKLSTNSQQAYATADATLKLMLLLNKFEQGNRVVCQEICIAGYEVVLTLVTRSHFPEIWAMIQHNLGELYLECWRGERAENIEKAIRCFYQELEIHTPKRYPQQWLGAKNDLGLAYSDRIKGERSENIKQAIQHLTEAIQAFPPERFTELWFKLKSNLASISVENTEDDIEDIQQELSQLTRNLFTKEENPKEWANIQLNIGDYYDVNHTGDRAKNLEKAIHSYTQALQVFSPETYPEEWGKVQQHLGNSYLRRIRGDEAENIESAIDCFTQALQVRTQQHLPEAWAKTKSYLGIAFRRRIDGDKSENLELSLQHCQDALQVDIRARDPHLWAEIQLHLATVYVDRMRGSKTENIKQAIFYFQQALQEYTPERNPEFCGLTHMELGIAYGGIQDFEKAIYHFQEALQVCTRDRFPERWADIQHNLGGAYANRIQGNHQENIALAIHCWQQELEIYTPNRFPRLSYDAGRSLAFISLMEDKWETAIQGYATAIEAIETYRTWDNSETRRQEILEEAIDVYQEMVEICIKAGQIEKAFEYAERSRSKRLVDLMASNDLYQSGEIPPAVKELLQQYEQLQQQIDQERDRPKANDNGSQTRAVFQAYNEAIASLEAEKQQVWEQIRRLDPVLAGEIQVSAPNFSAIQKLIDQPTTAILSFYTTDNDTHIFVLQQNQITLHTCAGQGIETLQDWIEQNWISAYTSDIQTWNSQINQSLGELAQRLQLSELISQHLEGIEELILVPHLLLHQIPFAALPIGNHQYLGDQFLIRYTPSCQILEFCQQRDKIENCELYGTVEDATDDLPCASFEGEQLAKLYNIPHSQRLRGSIQATKANYRQLAQQVQVLHCCHHAESCLDNPLASYLKLGDGTITLGQLMTPGWRLPNLSDVFLSCCETNLGIPGLTDDILTLSTGFLCAGARSVVSTLWAVDDLATAVFSVFYYQHRQQGKSRPEALRQAQISLRSLRKEDIKEISPEAQARERELIKSRKQYSPGTLEHRQWEREYKMYARFNRLIQAIESSTEEYPFSHPRYWSAFICQGLR
ncbi:MULTISPECIES: CHAT domain-containing protein [unclassified Tolypothrix]|uniref:CHAT domain-containing protein n=1 Tax=unclassified Tolypothrix TaxID=2649714 RepID=UPI0005EAC076|nr:MULTISPECIES: CHAT domain-containing tetratricopeptide repeat protein [unclassified Tolypothrix]EKF04855.1 putative flagellar protein FliS [Tolypothrix sp. PCC 7601]BAY91965.1 TPR repeat-containing protein [Microchaete diplosiphon NIES-3275]